MPWVPLVSACHPLDALLQEMSRASASPENQIGKSSSAQCQVSLEVVHFPVGREMRTIVTSFVGLDLEMLVLVWVARQRHQDHDFGHLPSARGWQMFVKTHGDRLPRYYDPAEWKLMAMRQIQRYLQTDLQ